MSPLSDSRLPDWLQGVSLDPGETELEANRARVQAVTQALSTSNALAVFAYAYSLPSDAGAGFDVVVSAVRGQADDSWAPDPSSVLARRLAAGSIADLLGDGSSDATVLLAQAALSAEFCGYDSPLPDIPDLARNAVARISTERRRREAVSGSPLEDELEQTIKAVTIAEGEGAVTVESLRQVLAQTRSVLRNVVRRVDLIEKGSRHRRVLVDEELDVLWWAQGDVSNVLGEPWSESGEAATLIAPFELGSLTHVQPPPRSALGLIWAALDSAAREPSGKVQLQLSVESAAGDLPAVVSSYGSSLHGLLPISAALVECSRKNGDPAWATGFKAECGLDPVTSYRRIDLGIQFLREMSLQSLSPEQDS